jgi:hypothetical protein
MRLAVHVAGWEKEEKFVQCFSQGGGIVSERDDLEDLSVDGSMILKWTLKN